MEYARRKFSRYLLWLVPLVLFIIAAAQLQNLFRSTVRIDNLGKIPVTNLEVRVVDEKTVVLPLDPLEP